MAGDVTYEVDSPEFLEKVEDAWYERTKGEIVLVPDPADAVPNYDRDLADVAERLAAVGQEFAATVDCEQMDGRGEVIEEVSAEEMARRVSLALYVVMFGGQ